MRLQFRVVGVTGGYTTFEVGQEEDMAQHIEDNPGSHVETWKIEIRLSGDPVPDRVFDYADDAELVRAELIQPYKDIIDNSWAVTPTYTKID